MSVLRSCPDIISRILKDGSSVLLAAKVLVISRLLHTKLSQRRNPPSYLESLRIRLGNLRRRLLGKIDRRLKDFELSTEAQIETMCAFSLATSSSLKDVLRHYHHVRLEAISERIKDGEAGHENVLLALRIYVKTLKDTQAIMPGQLAHALKRLKSVSLFKSPDVYSLRELDLDIYNRWIEDDIKTFTPYIRHDDLSKAEAESSLKAWAERALLAFLEGLRNRIVSLHDPQELLNLRMEVLKLWLFNRQNSMGFDLVGTLDGLRHVFNAQAMHIVEMRSSMLANIGLIVEEILQDWQPGTTDLIPSLWESSMFSMNMANGGKAFKENLMSRAIGKNEPLNRVSQQYAAFIEGIEAVAEMIEEMRQTKWDDHSVDMEEEDDLLDDKQTLLGEDDPRLVQDKLKDALRRAYAELERSLDSLNPHNRDASCGKQSSFLIRVWRKFRQRLPKDYQNDDLGMRSIPILQRILADEALEMPIGRYSKRLARMSAQTSPSERPLWEGEPALPVLPSSWTYQFLFDLMTSMSSYGTDLWSIQATNGLKEVLILSIEPILKRSPMGVVLVLNGHTNGDNSGVETIAANKEHICDGSNDEEREKSKASNVEQLDGVSTNGTSTSCIEGTGDEEIQRLFDVFYLTNATAVKDLDRASNALVNLQTSLIKHLALGNKSVERIEKNAGEYWKRTSLLFSFLS